MPEMKKDTQMLVGYIAGGLLVVGLVPLAIYSLSSLLDKIFRIEVIPNTTVRWIIITMLLIAGIIYAVWSIVVQKTIGKGGPVQIGNIEISPRTENLVVSGPYKYTRNPMLFGTFLLYLAFALFINSFASVVIVFALIVFMLTVVVKMEEKRLLKDFGSRYEEYRKNVSKFIPWFQQKNGK